MFAVRVPDGEWDKKVLLQFEREMLGLYVSDHPLFGLEHVLSAAADSSIAAVQADAAAESQKLTLTGILTGVNRRVTKAGAPWASATLEDLEGSIEVMFFPSTYGKVALDVAEDAIVAVKGHTDAREDTVKFIASDLTQLDTTQSAPRGPVAGHHAAQPVHAADGRAAQGRPGHPPRPDRGAPDARQRRAHPGAAVAGRFPGHRRPPR